MRVSALQTFLLAATLCLASAACAQGRGGGGPGGGLGGGRQGSGGMGGMSGGEMNRPSMSAPNRNSAPNVGESRGSLALGPSGRWWDNREFARSIGVDAKQQRRMDEVFSANRDSLLKCYKTLQHEEAQLDKLARSKELDENQIFQQIDRVTQARGELEKASAHMLLQIRKELNPEQLAKLDSATAS